MTCDQTARRPPADQYTPGRSPAHQHGYRGRDDQVNVEELSVAKVGLVRVQDEDGDELDHGVKGHVLEDAEGGDQSAPALQDQARHAGDVGDLGGEGGGH